MLIGNEALLQMKSFSQQWLPVSWKLTIVTSFILLIAKILIAWNGFWVYGTIIPKA